ncbi:Maf family protein [Nitrospira sp. Nam74]
MRLILASTSPRRQDLLALLNTPFETVAPTYVERLSPHVCPVDQACLFAEGKARSCEDLFADGLIIGCDTLIELESQVLGKPSDSRDAVRMLQRLSGRQHLIHTGVVVLSTSTSRLETAVETVHVWFKSLSSGEVEAYVGTGESFGKAGAYGIQGRGADLIERIEGDYTAAVGLPLKTLVRLLEGFGIIIPVDLNDVYEQKSYPNWRRFTSASRAEGRLQ